MRLRTPRTSSKLLWIASILVLQFTLASATGGQTPGEYSVKAAFLLNFTRYTDWPEPAFGSDTAPLVLCIIGEDPFGPALDSVEGRSVRGHPIRIDRNATTETLRNCHVAFISNSERSTVDRVLKTIGNLTVLTVSDIDRFARKGGIIGLSLEGERIRFEVNLKAAERAQLRLSSNLLRLASIVRE